VVKKYEDAPIQEAVCEFNFSQTDDWDPTYLGLIYSKLRGEFPSRRKVTAYGFDLSSDDEPRIRSEERVRLFSEEEKSLVQVGAHFLSANRLKPYQSWNDFLQTIEAGYEAYQEVVEPTALQRISLRYINKVVLDGESVDLSEYFNLGISAGEDVADPFNSFIVGMVSEYRDGADSLKIQMTNTEVEEEDKVGVILELEYSLAQSDQVEISGAREWLENAHGVIERKFEAIITEKLRNEFGQIVSGAA